VHAISELEPLHRLSSAEYHRLVESGGLDEDTRVELLDGLLVAMRPKTREHEQALSFLVRWLVRALNERYEVRAAAPLSLADCTEPEPDVAVIPPGVERPYHPATAALVIEIAVSSQHRDFAVKPLRYAAAGVPVYIVVDLDTRRVVEHNEPTGGGYGRASETDQLDPRLPGVGPLAVAEVYAAAFRR
jgi:Uma2 family endonuclease